MKPYEHAKSSAKMFGGKYEDYIEIHKFFDIYRFSVGDPRHRMFLHNTTGVMLCEKVFGDVIINSDNKEVVVRDIAEQHILQDLGKIPTPEEWLKNINAKEWVKPFEANLEKKAKKNLEETDKNTSVEELKERDFLDFLDDENDIDEEDKNKLADILDKIEDEEDNKELNLNYKTEADKADILSVALDIISEEKNISAELRENLKRGIEEILNSYSSLFNSSDEDNGDSFTSPPECIMEELDRSTYRSLGTLD